MLRLRRLAAVTALTLAATALLPATAHAGNSDTTCTGTLQQPGVLVGTYSGNVTVSGLCLVNSGAAVINGNLTITAGSGLGAAYALNHAGPGTSSLTVRGNISVAADAVLSLGCTPLGEPCMDDRAATTAHKVSGNIRGVSALGVVLYADIIGGNVDIIGGGGGVSCDPPFPGFFGAVGSPAFSDAEDNVIGGNLTYTGVQSCWIGAIRNTVRGNVTIRNNTLADWTAMMTVSNHVGGNLTCTGNTPVAHFAVGGTSNVVRGSATGECGFDVKQPNPGPDGPLQPISVRG